jgi:hypothetical protein
MVGTAFFEACVHLGFGVMHTWLELVRQPTRTLVI